MCFKISQWISSSSVLSVDLHFINLYLYLLGEIPCIDMIFFLWKKNSFKLKLEFSHMPHFHKDSKIAFYACDKHSQMELF